MKRALCAAIVPVLMISGCDGCSGCNNGHSFSVEGARGAEIGESLKLRAHDDAGTGVPGHWTYKWHANPGCVSFEPEDAAETFATIKGPCKKGDIIMIDALITDSGGSEAPLQTPTVEVPVLDRSEPDASAGDAGPPDSPSPSNTTPSPSDTQPPSVASTDSTGTRKPYDTVPGGLATTGPIVPQPEFYPATKLPVPSSPRPPGSD